MEKPTAAFELSVLVVGVGPKLKEGFGNVGTVVASTSVKGTDNEGGGAPKVNVDVSDIIADFFPFLYQQGDIGFFGCTLPPPPQLTIWSCDTVTGFRID